MSFFGRSKKPKTSSSRDRKSQTSADGVKNTSGQQTGSSDTGASLFSGMTLTSACSPASATTAGNDLSLMGDTESGLGLIKQQSASAETAGAVTQDFSTVLAIPEVELLPEPMQPIPVNIPQQVCQSATKKKKSRHIIRPGYARQPDSKAGHLSEQSHDSELAVEKSCDTVEQERVTCTVKQDVENLESSKSPDDCTPTHPTPLYSIGTPSSSDENLFQESETLTDTGNLIMISSEGALKDGIALHIQAQGHVGNEAEVLTDASTSENMEMESVPPRIGYSLEGDKLSVLLETAVTFSDCSTLDSHAAKSIGSESDLQAEVESNEEVDQNEEHDELQQSTGDLFSSFDMESAELGVTEQSLYDSMSVISTDKLSIALQHMDSQLSTLSEDKRSLKSLEEELFNMYTDTESTVSEMEHQVKELQLEESQALAIDNYDLAEEISNRVEELKADLESSRYRLPAQDEKVEKALKLRAEVAEKEAEIYRQSQTTLEQLREEQQECLTNHREMSTVWNAREKQRLNSDRLRLERAKDHLRLDKEHMETENRELSKEIVQQTEAFLTRKEQLILERGLLQVEISALEAKLSELKQKEAEFTDSIKQEENKIESVKMEFTPQQNALDKQQQEIEAREMSLREEFDLLLSTQKQFDDKTAEHCTKEKELTEVLSAASDKLEKSKQVIKCLEEQRQFVQEFLNMNHFTFDTDSKLARLNSKQNEVSQQIKALSNKIQFGQRGVVTLRKSLNEIEAQISDLDAAKEIAKQERNFKEAKRLKEEREALTKEGVENQGKLESLLKELAVDKKLLENAEQENNDLDSEISEKDLQAAMVTMKKASLVIQTLQEQIYRIGDDDLVKALLEAEAKTCKNLMSDLCDKHNIPIPDLDHSQVDIETAAQEISENTEEVPEPQNSSECERFEEKTKGFEELQEELSELEERLEAVVEVEDFDEADRLQQEITKIKEVMEQRRAGHV